MTYTTTSFNRKDILFLAVLSIIVLIIYYPVFDARYIYTDEGPQFWLAAKGVNNIYIQDGRWFTAKLNNRLFSHAFTVRDVMHARLFSLIGWMLCLPVFYYIIRDTIARNNLPAQITPLSLVYIICMPPFAVYIGWAACLEMFIACTAALISGYTLYRGIQYNDHQLNISNAAVALSVVTGILSLFTYQSCFACFYIPFLVQFIAERKISRRIIAGIITALIIYVLYYLLFKRSLHLNNMDVNIRGEFAPDPLKKLLFLFTRPLASSFHFTTIFNEKSIAGEIIYLVILMLWLMADFISMKAQPILQKLIYYAGVIAFFVLGYLPSLIIAESYSSNRTLFALNLMVFLLVATTLFSFSKTINTKKIMVWLIGAMFITNAWYNFRWQFIYPLVKEYSLINGFIAQRYTASVKAMYVIRPAENAFEKKYGIAASWDEFGIPSTAKVWTPESLLQQIVFEKTGNRVTADKLIVKSWPDRDTFIQSGETVTKDVLFIDIGQMLDRSSQEMAPSSP